MSGTVEGAKKGEVTRRKRYGNDFHARIGKKGGQVKGIAKGFALMDPKKLSEISRKGGKSGRPYSVNPKV